MGCGTRAQSHMVRSALVVGGASCVWDDLRALGPWAGLVVAINDAIAVYPHRIDHAATLHPEKLAGWCEERARRGGNPDYLTWSRKAPEVVDRVLTGWNGGSSGLFAVGVALEAGAERVVLTGVPLDARPHFWDAEAWEACNLYRAGWEKRADELRGRAFSCSGWTRELLGPPAEMLGHTPRVA